MNIYYNWLFFADSFLSDHDYDTDSEFGGKLISLVSVYILHGCINVSKVFDDLKQASYYELSTLKKSVYEWEISHTHRIMYACIQLWLESNNWESNDCGFFYIEEEAPVVSVCNILISRYICPFCYACNLNST